MKDYKLSRRDKIKQASAIKGMILFTALIFLCGFLNWFVDFPAK